MRDLIRKMLEVDPSKRITARDVELHDWIMNTENRDRSEYCGSQMNDEVSKEFQMTRAVGTSTGSKRARDTRLKQTKDIQEGKGRHNYFSF